MSKFPLNVEPSGNIQYPSKLQEAFRKMPVYYRLNFVSLRNMMELGWKYSTEKKYVLVVVWKLEQHPQKKRVNKIKLLIEKYWARVIAYRYWKCSKSMLFFLK